MVFVLTSLEFDLILNIYLILGSKFLASGQMVIVIKSFNSLKSILFIYSINKSDSQKP